MMDKTQILKDIKTYYCFKTNADFARFLGITPPNLNQWYTRNTFDINILATKCKAMNPEWLLTGEGEMLKSTTVKEYADIDNIPLVVGKPDTPYEVRDVFMSSVIAYINMTALYDITGAAGYGTFKELFDLGKAIKDYLIPLEFSRVDFAIRVAGDSMAPNYKSGDIIVCRQIKDKQNLQWGKVYLSATPEYGLLLKRLDIDDNGDIILSSDNHHYKSFTLSQERINDIAMVVGLIRAE